jgi:hypothetical protein
MSKYLLLRSNKQSGPFSLEEIQAMELKAYDLIWIEGKSAAWRYPSEIDELKSFAKVIEEQPYDRFFKKPSAENQLSHSGFQYTSHEKDTRDGIIRRENTIRAQAQSVYVNMPGVKRESPEKEIPAKEPDRRIYSGEPANAAFATKESLPALPDAFKTSMTERDAVLEEKFSQPLDEIKKEYVEKLLHRNGSRSRRRNTRPLVLGFGVAALLGCGILIGLLISKRGNNSSQKDLVRELAMSDQPGDDRTKTIPVYSPSAQPEKRNDNAQLNQAAITSQMVQADKDQSVVARKKTKVPRQKPVDSFAPAQITTSSTDSAALVSQHEAARKTEAQLAKEAIKDNIINYIFLSGNKYTVGTFGGISDLQITVSNRSAYPMDLVVVEVQYVQSNKKIFKTENLYFHNLGAGVAIMEEAPKSSRGIKVQYRIALINSKELGLSYTGL